MAAFDIAAASVGVGGIITFVHGVIKSVQANRQAVAAAAAREKAAEDAQVAFKKSEAQASALSDSAAHAARAELFKKISEDTQKALEDEIARREKDRAYWHGRAEEWQKTLNDYQLKISNYQQQPDLGDIVRVLQGQATSLQDISKTLLSQAETLSGVLKQQSQIMRNLETLTNLLGHRKLD